MSPKSGTSRVLLTKRECIREFYLLHLKGFWTDFLLSYRKKNLRNNTLEFIEGVRRSMGVHCVVLMGYELPNSMKTAARPDVLRTM
jgi:hypothetical protein